MGPQGPKGVYSTLTALQNAFPTGTDGTYVVSENGHWYYWNGSAWTDGGVYQAIQLADNSVETPDLVDGCITTQKTFIDIANKVISYNVQCVNVSEAITNKYWQSDGTQVTSSGYIAYPAFNLKKGTYYCYRLAKGFTYIKNANTGVITPISDYISDTNPQFSTHTVVVPFDFVVMITSTTTSNYYTLTYFTDDATNTSNSFYGYYNFKFDGKDLSATNPVFYVGANRQFTKLKDGIAEAVLHKNSTVYVDDGTYDLVSEYGLEVLNGTSSISGIELKNNVHVIFSSKSKVVFNYTGNNSHIHRVFSPFNAGVNGFILENLTLECSNCRYCVHDERGGSTDSYSNKYINCNMKIDNSNNPNWTNSNSIGGGLGFSGEILVDGGEYYGMISYHENQGKNMATSKSNIVIRNAYFTNSTESNNIMITCASSSSQNEKTNVYIYGNSFIKAPYTQTRNCFINHLWNNEVRGS